MAKSQSIPRLSAGDRLSRVEFERRYAAMPECKKAELIEGVVYMPSPVSYVRHGNPHGLLTMWMVTYAVETTGTGCADNTTVRLDLDNEPQPDLLLRILSECGGRSRIDADGYVEGAPELTAEVTASRVSYDLHDKLRVYRRNAVQEYVVWCVDDAVVDWFALHNGVYEPMPADADGIVRSEVFPGLWLCVPALLVGDGKSVLRVLQQGLASFEHASFAERLAGSRPSP